MQEMKEAVASAFERLIAVGAIEKAIQERLEKTVTETIREELGSYSDFGKQLKEQVKDALQVDFSKLGIPGYNDFILKIIRRQVEADVSNTIAQHIEKQVTDLLAPAPGEIKLSELVAQFIEANKPDGYSCSCDDPSRITLNVEESQYGSQWISLDKESGKDRYSCSIRFAVSNDDGKIFALRVDGQEIAKTLFVGDMYRFERSIFQMHVAGTKLIVDGDENSINTWYAPYDD